MIRVFSGALMALSLLAGCAPARARQEREALDDRLSKMEARFRDDLDKAFRLHQDLTQSILKLEKRLAELENENRLLKVDVDRMRDKLASAQPVPPPPADPLSPSPELAEISARIDAELDKLKSGGDVEAASRELLPLSRYSAARMVETIGKNPRNVAFTRALEKILARCPAEDLKAPLAEAVKDRPRRTSVAAVIGATKNRDLSSLLEPYVGEDDPIQQVEIGEALLACRNRLGVSPLLRALRSPDSEFRFRAILLLKRLKGGDAMGFDFNKDAGENADALRAWDEWWEKSGPKLFE